MLTISRPAIDVGTSEAALVASGINQHIGDHQTLHNVSFEVTRGEVLAIAGGSGAGKTSLLEALVGLRPISAGEIRVDGGPVHDGRTGPGIGFVPQDDILHLELPLRQTLEHTAALRLPTGTSGSHISSTVQHTMERLDLAHRADVPIRALSGGQRKRASIAAELLTDPSLFFLDEPTSGLDPSTAAEVISQLQRLAAEGTTVVLTTHAPSDLHRCDRVVFLARDGHVAFIGTAAEACAYFDVADLTGVYEALARTGDPAALGQRFAAHRASDAFAEPANEATPAATVIPRAGTRPTRARRQWWALTRREVALLTHNRLTLAILLGSPAMVVGMMAVLFRSGTFSADAVSPMPAIQTLFWVAFASFFFGVTYGLLQVVGEFEIFRRERLSGLRVGAYIAAKMTVLGPVLLAVNAGMLVILRGLDRLPGLPAQKWGELLFTLVLISFAAVSMGLLASSAVHNAAQATLALPMLCFPQVLFAGAVVPISEMAGAGRVMSTVLADRWGFEAIGRIIGLDAAVANDAATSGYLDSFTGSPATGWMVLSAITVGALGSTAHTLQRRTRTV